MISRLKNKIKQSKLTIGSWLTIPNNSIAEIFATNNFDWLVIDLEHSSISLSEASEMIRVIDLAGNTPLVRITSNNEDQIKRVLDAGAHGIIVPMVNSQEDVNKILKSVYYNPIGNRGVGLARAQGYGENFKEYNKWLKKNLIVIIQIEHFEAVENLDSILSEKKIDAIFVGPYDLSASMGIAGNFENKKFKKAINKILTTAKKYKCLPGIHVVEPDEKLLNKAIKEGFKFISYSVDFRFLKVLPAKALKKIKK